MSIQVHESFNCPKCGQVQEVTIWQSLNRQIHPDAAQKLMDGTLFNHECTECGYAANLSYPILYNDMENWCMVQYLEDEGALKEFVEATESMTAGAAQMLGRIGKKYTQRVAFSQNDLREKALMLKDGLDDAAMEALKVVIKVRLEEGGCDMRGKHLYYVEQTPEGQFVFEVPDYNKSLTVQREFYDGFVETGVIPDAAKDEYVIDELWALRYLLEKTDGN